MQGIVIWTIEILKFLFGATLALIMYLVFIGAVVTLYQGIKWLLTEDKKDE